MSETYKQNATREIKANRKAGVQEADKRALKMLCFADDGY